MRFDYTLEELFGAYRALGITQGDSLFVTTGLGFLGRLRGVLSLQELCKAHLNCIQEIIGPSGTLIVPTYSYSFGKEGGIENNIFDVSLTLSAIGDFPNYVINEDGFLRTHDPMMSVCIWGLHAKHLAKDLPQSSYGIGCLFERLLNLENMKCLSVGLGTNWTPFIHYFDYVNRFEYRYDKLFMGSIYDNSKLLHRNVTWNYSVPARLNKGSGNCQKLGRMAELNNIWDRLDVGRSQIACAFYKQLYSFATEFSKTHCWPTTLNSMQDIRGSEANRLEMLTTNWLDTDLVDKIDDTHWNSFNGISGFSLQEIFSAVSQCVAGVTLDHFEVLTGSNIGKYVVPESIYPVGLNIRYESGEVIFSSCDRELISKYVLPSSSSFKGTLQEITSLDETNLAFSSSNINIIDKQLLCIYNHVFDFFFNVTDNALNALVDLRAVAQKDILIHYQSSRYFSSIEAIVIMPNSIARGHSINLYCIDTLTLMRKDWPSLGNYIKQLISNNITIIICPSGYALPLFKANTGLEVSNFETIIRGDRLSSVENEFIESKMILNPAINNANLTINTLNYLVT